MMSKARFLGRALHPALVVVPVGLLAATPLWDVLHLATRSPLWAQMAFFCMVAGLLTGVVAAVPGVIDWMALPRGTRARRIGTLHAALWVVTLSLFLIDASVRAAAGYARPPVGAIALGWLALSFGLVAGWLGAELVERLGVSVHDGAHLEADSSLRGDQPAPARREQSVAERPGGSVASRRPAVPPPIPMAALVGRG
jgi:uncharacterized membrane protein